MKLDLSSLTGESEPQERHPVLAGEPTRPAAEAGNLAFNSTLCISGEAWGVVIRTGDETFIGQIAGLTGAANNIKSPLSIEIDAFVKYVSFIAISTAILFFIIGIGSVYKGQAGPTVTFAITILISWVPGQCNCFWKR